MTELSQNVLNNYKVRKTQKQKDEFINLVRQYYPQMQIQQTSGLFKSKNLIIGNLSKANTIVCAHYDTGTNLFISNAWFPRNALMYTVYQLLVALPLMLAMVVGCIYIWKINPWLALAYIYCCVMLHCVSTSFGVTNKNNANCNTSGVITIFEILDSMNIQEQKNVAFVLFDNKEKGFIGSNYFKKRYKTLLQKKIVVNLECVGDGDNIMVVQNKKAIEKYTTEIMSAFKKSTSKNIILESANRAIIPSDQIGFPCYLSITAFKKSASLGLYLDKIRTKKDTTCDMKNIAYLKQAIAEFIKVNDVSESNNTTIPSVS